MTSIYLMMTNKCNMNCSYCYEREFFKDNKKDITLETAKRAVDWLIENRIPGHKARPDEDINICFFGGEPTLNWKIVKETSLYCRALEKEKNISIGLYLLTNGFKLPEPEDEFLKDMHDLNLKMQISLDGCQKAHDTTRGNFKEIIENAKKIIKHCKHNVIVRMTVTPQNVHHAYESFQAMASLSCIVNMIPIVEEEWKDDAVETAKREFKKIMNYYQRLSNSRAVRFNIAEDCNDVGFRPCQAGGTMTCVTVDGLIYPCHRFQFHDKAETEWKMGDIWKGAERYARFSEIFKDCYACDSRICHPCPSAFIRSGNNKAPEHYCRLCKEVEAVCLPQAKEVREFNEKRVNEKMQQNILKLLGEITECVKKS